MPGKLRPVAVWIAACTLLLSCGAPNAASKQVPPTMCELVVLASPEDAFLELAAEISAAEGAPLVSTPAQALAYDPEFLLWVASPAGLSEAAIIEFGLALRPHHSAVATGLITGATLDQARSLWQRRTEVRGETMAAVNAPNPAAHIDAGRITLVHGQPSQHPLTHQTFREALQSVDYLTFTGHGGNNYLRLDDETKVTNAELPTLADVVVSTGSCRTLRPWNWDSIALAFVDRGAAAYSGFVFSPNEGYLLGEFTDLPFGYTWPGVPIGHVLQAQTRGTLQGFAAFPYLFLLGDPRIALQTEAPYRLVDDRPERGRRVLTYADVPAGAVPLRIPGGAGDQFVSVPGVTAVAHGDPFYNSRLQMVDVRADKIIVLIHEGGDLALELRRRPPWAWYPADILLDSLDHTLVFSQQTGGDALVAGVGVLSLIWMGWQTHKRRLSGPQLRTAVAAGLGAAGAQAVYVLTRLDRVTITSKAVAFSPLSIAAGAVVTTCGILIALRARHRVGRWIGLATMTVASWLPLAFTTLTTATINLLSRSQIGTPLYNYRLGLLSAPTFALMLVLSGLLLPLVAGTGHAPVTGPAPPASGSQSGRS